MRSVPGQHSGSCGPSSPTPGRRSTRGPAPPTWTWWAPTSTTGTAAPTTPTRHTASGQLDHDTRWRRSVAQPGGLDWLAQLSRLTGKPIAIPEWGLDFHSFGGQDDPAFITGMLGVAARPPRDRRPLGGPARGPLSGCPPGRCWLAAWRVRGQPGQGDDLGLLLGGRLQYAEAFLPDDQPVSDSSAQPVLAAWQHAGYRLILSVPLVPLTVPSYNGPPAPGHPYQLADYPDALAAFRQGISYARRS